MISDIITSDGRGITDVTNSVIEDVFSVGATKETAITKEDYEDYDLYSKAPNRKKHAPYVMRILFFQLLADYVKVKGKLDNKA